MSVILAVTVTCVTNPGPFTITHDGSPLAIVNWLLSSAQVISEGGRSDTLKVRVKAALKSLAKSRKLP